MAVQTLAINVTSSVGGALPGINNVTSGLTGMGNAASTASTSIGRLAPAFQQNRSSLQTFIGQARAGQLSIQGLSGAATSLGPSLQRATRPTASAANALTNLGRVASDLPFGFIAIQNNLDPLISSFGLVFSAAGGLQGGFKALGQALLGPAGIGLAFSVASSAATSLIQKYGSLGNAVSALNPFISNAGKAQAAWTSAMQKAIEPAAKEISNVNLLYAATQDLNVPLEERKRIADDLIKQYPQSFKGLNAEKILAGEAADAYDRLSKSLLATATIKAAQSFVEENQKALIGLRLEATRLDQRLRDLRAPDTGFISEDPIAVDRKINAAINEQNKNRAKQRDLEEQNANILAEQLKLIEQYGAAAAGVTESADTQAKRQKTVKTELDKQQEVVKSLRERIVELNAEFLATGGTVQDLTQDKIKAFGKALGDLTNVGAGPGSGLFTQIQEELSILQQSLSRTAVTIKVPIAIQPLPAASNTAAIEGIAKGVAADFRRAFVSETDKTFAELLQNSARDGIAAIATGIGEGIGGGGIKAAISGFVTAISSFGEKLGKQLIVQGLAIEAFNTSLKQLKGVQAIAAGGALIAASVAFRALATGGIGSFATGGTAFGPQLALIGDNPGREEHIIPSEVLDKLGTGSGFIAETRMSFSDLVIALKRAERNG